MLSPLIRFLFPKACLYCGEIHPGKELLCQICLVGLDLIHPKRRCETCFRESVYRKCLYCIKIPSPWYKAGALFEKKDAAEVLLSDPDRFGKEIAAFFTVQYIRLKWQIPFAFYAEKKLHAPALYFSKFFSIRRVHHRNEYAGQKILFLAIDPENTETPKFLQGARIHLLSFLTSS